MKKNVSSIPNTLTCLNLALGCAAIVFAFQHDFITVFWLVIAACVCDFLDGFAARMLKAYSPTGADLDSLADMVSFGVVPSVVLYQMMTAGFAESSLLPMAAFLVAVFSALRLAKFNNDPRQSEEFRGLATPASAIFVVSLGAIAACGGVCPALLPALSDPVVLLATVVALCGLMVCDIPMFSFKFKNFGLKNNLVRYIFILFAAVVVLLLEYAAPAVIILAYVLVSLFRRIFSSKVADAKTP